MAIDRAPWNALVDDDGSNLVGTVWNKDKIKTVILDPIDAMAASTAGAWKNIANGVIIVQNDSSVSQAMTVWVNRYRQIGGNTVVWNFGASPVTVTAPTTNLYITGIPFSLLGPADSRNDIAYAPVAAHLKFYNAVTLVALRNDGSPWAAGTNWLYFTVTLEASGS